MVEGWEQRARSAPLHRFAVPRPIRFANREETVSPEVHAAAARAAELSRKSLNAWGEEALNQAAV